MIKTIFTICLFVFSISSLSAEEYATVCSLNLHRLGDKGKSLNSKQFTRQRNYLGRRVKETGCDIVALQELVGNKKKSQKILTSLIDSIDLDSKNFEFLIADSNDSWNRNAFIYNSRKFELIGHKSWNKQSLPKLDIRSSPWSHTRGPFSLVLKSKTANAPHLVLVNYHLKSKASSWKDPTGTSYELARVLASAGIREILNKESRSEQGGSFIKILLGDRNSNVSGGASEILSGRLKLKDFSKEGSCRISPEGTALCPPDKYRRPNMLPLIQKVSSETSKDNFTYKMGKRGDILDEIYLDVIEEPRVRDKSGKLLVGVMGEYRKGSDHLMPWARIRID